MSAENDRVTTKAIAERLKEARQRKYRSAAAAARALGMKEVTVRAHESGQNALPIDVGLEYCRAYGVSPSWLMSGLEYPDYVEFLKENGPDLTARKPRSAILVPIVGVAEVGSWRELPEEDQEVLGHVGFYDPHHRRGSELYAVEVRGRTEDPTYPEGTVVIVTPGEGGAHIGDHALVRRQRGDLFETLIVEVGYGVSGGYLLTARATPPGRSLTIDTGKQGEAETPSVLGSVIAWVRVLPFSEKPYVKF